MAFLCLNADTRTAAFLNISGRVAQGVENDF
jgi:hypothetical protein